MNEDIKEKLKNARSAEEAISIARKYGYDTELRSGGAVDDDALSAVSGGVNVVSETHASYSVAVLNNSTGEVFCVLPY